MTTAWTFLVVAGLFEIGWPIGLKIGQAASMVRFLGVLLIVAGVATLELGH